MNEALSQKLADLTRFANEVNAETKRTARAHDCANCGDRRLNDELVHVADIWLCPQCAVRIKRQLRAWRYP